MPYGFADTRFQPQRSALHTLRKRRRTAGARPVMISSLGGRMSLRAMSTRSSRTWSTASSLACNQCGQSTVTQASDRESCPSSPDGDYQRTKRRVYDPTPDGGTSIARLSWTLNPTRHAWTFNAKAVPGNGALLCALAAIWKTFRAATECRCFK
jgi:hypothetical protein